MEAAFAIGTRNVHAARGGTAFTTVANTDARAVLCDVPELSKLCLALQQGTETSEAAKVEPKLGACQKTKADTIRFRQVKAHDVQESSKAVAKTTTRTYKKRDKDAMKGTAAAKDDSADEEQGWKVAQAAISGTPLTTATPLMRMDSAKSGVGPDASDDGLATLVQHSQLDQSNSNAKTQKRFRVVLTLV